MALQDYSEQKEYKNIEIVQVDNAAASFSNWPAQLENINLTQIHKQFLADCSTKYSDLISGLSGITIWMINSTVVGGGVAEMLPMLISMFANVKITIKWVVISPSKNEYEELFFNLTKQIHNNVHGVFDKETMETLSDKHRNILENVCGDAAREFIPLVSENDIIVIHDPQPLAMIKFMKEKLNNLVFWRCHIGGDNGNKTTADTWQFLSAYISMADHIIYSVRDYIPSFVLQESQSYSIIPPAICPFQPKNIELSPAHLMNIFAKCGIIYSGENTQLWKYKAQKVCAKTGKLVTCSTADNPNHELLFSPVICEISRWDALKGWIQLMKAFVYVKQQLQKNEEKETNNNNNILRDMILVLVGPDPSFIQDDPEGVRVFRDLCTFYLTLSADIQSQIYIFSLPMDDRVQNALIVNALQRFASIMVQNSLMEGFGLTVTEAMYKGTPMIASNVGGIKIQVAHKVNGIMIDDASDYKSVASAIQLMVKDGQQQMTKYALAAKQNVMDKFLIWSQCRNYLDAFACHIQTDAVQKSEKKEDNNYMAIGLVVLIIVVALYFGEINVLGIKNFK